jgi:hypothetical protein
VVAELSGLSEGRGRSKTPQRYVASCITTLGGSVDSCFGLLGGGGASGTLSSD